jgi:hypothetical protein
MADETKKQKRTECDDDEIGEEELQEEQRQLARFREEYEDTELYAPYTRNGKVINTRVVPYDSDNERFLKNHMRDMKRREKKQKRRFAKKNKKPKGGEEGDKDDKDDKDDEDDEDEAERAEVERRLKGCGKPMGQEAASLVAVLVRNRGRKT